MQPEDRSKVNLLNRVAIGTLIFIVVLLVGISAARAAEIVPSVGLARAGAGGGDTRTFFGVALRGSIVPMVKDEIAVGYRSENYFNGDLKVNMVPVTASLWLAPTPVFYAGGGVGVYHTSFSYRDALLIPGTSDNSFGMHVGGGMSMPLVPMVSLDLNGRYVFMEQKDTGLGNGKFDPDFWSTSLGIAIKF
jgi:hypothetical protein